MKHFEIAQDDDPSDEEHDAQTDCWVTWHDEADLAAGPELIEDNATVSVEFEYIDDNAVPSGDDNDGFDEVLVWHPIDYSTVNDVVVLDRRSYSDSCIDYTVTAEVATDSSGGLGLPEEGPRNACGQPDLFSASAAVGGACLAAEEGLPDADECTADPSMSHCAAAATSQCSAELGSARDASSLVGLTLFCFVRCTS